MATVLQPSLLDPVPDINARIDAMSRQDGGTLTIAPNRYVLDSQLIIKEGVKLSGEGNPSWQWKEGPSSGVIFEVNWGDGIGSCGDPSKAAVLLNSGAAIDNILFDYPKQVPTLSQPLEWGSTIQMFDGRGCFDQSVTDCIFNKSYMALDFRGSKITQMVGRLTLSGIKGCPLYAALAIDWLADWGVIKDFSLNAGNPDEDHLTTGLVAWVANNGMVILAGGNDWLKCQNINAWGYKVGVRVMAAQGYQGAGPYSFDGCNFDATENPYLLSGKFQQPVSIIGGKNCAFNHVTGNSGIVVNSITGVEIAGLQVLDNIVFGPSGPLLYLDSQEVNDVIVSRNIARLNKPCNAFGVTVSRGNNIQVTDNILKGYAQPVWLGNSVTNRINERNQS